MIKNQDVAKQISELMLAMFRQLDESREMVRQTCEQTEFIVYNEVTGRLASSIVLEVLEPLYKDNPALKPSNWD